MPNVAQKIIILDFEVSFQNLDNLFTEEIVGSFRL